MKSGLTIHHAKYAVKRLLGRTRRHYSATGYHFYKCIFFHLHNTAGVSVNLSLFGNLGLGHINISKAETFFSKSEFEAYYKFTFVRHPYSRLHSAFHFLKNGGFSEKDKVYIKGQLDGITDFRMFLHEWLTEESCQTITHFIPQYQFVCREGEFEPIVDFIGKFESLSRDYVTVRQHIGGWHKLVTTNINTSKPRYQFSSDDRKKICELYAKDFELFGYDR